MRCLVGRYVSPISSRDASPDSNTFHGWAYWSIDCFMQHDFVKLCQSISAAAFYIIINHQEDVEKRIDEKKRKISGHSGHSAIRFQTKIWYYCTIHTAKLPLSFWLGSALPSICWFPWFSETPCAGPWGFTSWWGYVVWRTFSGGKYDDKRWLLFNPQTDRLFVKAEVKGMNRWGFIGNSKTMQASWADQSARGRVASGDPSMQEYSI